MERKHIDISNTCKIDGQRKNWVHTISAKGVTLMTANWKSLAIVKRNYYYSNKDAKVHYENTGEKYCDNASYDYLAAIYGEIYPGIFAYMLTANSTCISERIEQVTRHMDALSESNIEAWRKSLIRV